MENEVKQFSINDIQEVATEESDEFFYARICVLSTRPNSHKVLITDEILRRDGESVRGKWIVADPKYGESMSHTTTEFIVGIVPNDAKIDYVTDEDGYTSMYVDAVLSKIYGKQVYDMFKKDNQRNVSVEMLTADLDEDEYGNTPIEALKICGITILGKLINGSCPNANMIVTKFSQEEAEQYYNKKFAEEVDNNKDYKEDKMEDKKEFESNAEEDVIMAEDEKEKEMSAEQPQEKEMAENQEEVKEEPKQEEKEMAEQPQEDKVEEKEMGCGEKEMSEKEEDKVEEKKFSLKEYATLTFETETDEIKAFAEKVSEMSADEILTTVVELKKFQEARLSQDRDMKLQQIMASVKCDLDTKKFAELQEEGAKLSLNELGGFENKVKAFAYEATKNKEHQNDDGLMRFSNGEQQQEIQAELTADDIFNKYL